MSELVEVELRSLSRMTVQGELGRRCYAEADRVTVVLIDCSLSEACSYMAALGTM